MRLYIGNKNYSSWSMRPWIAMRAKGIDFEEELIPFNDDAGNPKFREFSPTGKVPVLVDGEVRVWESLAILEYLLEQYVVVVSRTDVEHEVHVPGKYTSEVHDHFIGKSGIQRAFI